MDDDAFLDFVFAELFVTDPNRQSASQAAIPPGSGRATSSTPSRKPPADSAGAPRWAAPRNVEQLRLLIHTLAGEKLLWLRPGQSLTVGGSRQAQFTVGNDAGLSPVHFCVECLPQEVRIRDLASASGTFVNGQRIESASLRDGDVVLAGATAFAVAVDYGQRAGGKARDHVATCTAEPCSCGLMRFYGNEAGAAPLDIALRLADALPLYLVIDYAGLGLSPRIGAPRLMNWLPRSLAEMKSPVVVSRRELSDFETLFKQAWGRDAVVCLYSDWEAQRLIEHLWIAARGQHRASAVAEPRHMLGAMHPGTLKTVLPQSAPAYADFLFSGVAALFFEGSSSDEWELLAPAAFVGVLSSVGIDLRG